MENNPKKLTGVMAVVYRDTEPREYLLVDQKSGHISFAGGGIEPSDQTIEDTLERELKEEITLNPDEYTVAKIDLLREFIYGPWKKERAGQYAKNQVFLVKVKTDLIVKPNKNEINGVIWLNFEMAKKTITLPDLVETFKKVVTYIK
jgi:8-oxo-dGTP pyrophosphatase MutT (NUDIX family)